MSPRMNFGRPSPRHPGDFVMPFGQYKGKTLAQIADEEEDILYLDWLLGEKESEGGEVVEALRAFLVLRDKELQEKIDRVDS